jgi:Uma2 family endonuclease
MSVLRARPAPPLPPEARLTVDEFMTLPEGDRKLELHEGRVVDVSPASHRHSRIQKRMLRRLDDWCAAHTLNEPLPELPCRLDSGRLLVPDVGYVRDAARSAAADEAGWLEGVPDLAVEVMSPSDRPADVRQKVQWYLDHGCSLLWLVDPQRRTATVYRPGAATRHLGEGDILDGEDVLPGLELPLTALWGGVVPR